MNKQHAKLPKFLQPQSINTLSRIGRDYDGGYIVDIRSVDSSEVLIGLGIADDWSFESVFSNKQKVPVYAFDASIGGKIFANRIPESIKKFIRRLIALRKDSLHSFLQIFHWVNILFQYKKFFTGNNHHIKKHVGCGDGKTFISISEIVEDILPEGLSNIFFKIDIEGSEYEILDSLIKYSDKIEGLVIEFHDLDSHLNVVKEFNENFPLNLCHVHCNNFAPLNNDNMPLVIECTYTKKSVGQLPVKKLPNNIDMPNKKGKPDYILTFT